jgi:solute carrier family 30 (zinc transporter), member 9
MAAATSVKAVISAIAGNTFVTVIKLVAFVLSGSGAMLSETIHSAADTGNQVLLFIGLRRGEREPDDRFHYGYGGERFVFGMLSAAGIFFIGCGITLYHGISSLLSPHMPQLTAITFVVLAASFVVEGGVLLYAVRSIAQQRGDMPFFRYVREHADPATVAILLEDGAAVLGLVLAAGGIVAAYVTGNPMWDSVGSIIVGLVLGLVAIYLVRENRELLLGRAVPEGVEERFVELVRKQPSVSSVRDVKTRQLTSEAFKFKAEITLDNDYLASRLDRALPVDPAALTGAGRAAAVKRVASFAADLIANEIAAIERAVRAAIPQARHIDLEISHPHEEPEGGAASSEAS